MTFHGNAAPSPVQAFPPVGETAGCYGAPKVRSGSPESRGAGTVSLQNYVEADAIRRHSTATTLAYKRGETYQNPSASALP